MTTSEFKKIATEKFNNISTNDLIIEAKKLMLNASNAHDIVFEVIISILFERMSEEDFIEFSISI